VNGRRTLRAVSATAVATLTLLAAHPALASADVPADPSAHGVIGLCDPTGKNLIAGDIRNAPFVWKAVASSPAPHSFQGRGENSVLSIFQVRPGVDATQWSGDQLTGTSFYSTPSHPTTQSTQSDIALSVITSEFPPMGDGYYELRMFYGRTDYGVYTTTYPATFIRVQGNRWSVAKGGQVDCAAGQAKSMEVLTGVAPAAAGPTARAYAVPAAPQKGWSAAALLAAVALVGAAVVAAVMASLSRQRRVTRVREQV